MNAGDTRRTSRVGTGVSRRAALAGLAVPLLFLPAFLRGEPGYLTPEQFGAKGDGRTPDAAAINRALAQLAELGGGELRFASGTYLIDRPLDGRMLRNVRLRGTGTLKAADGTNFPYLLDIVNTRDVVIEGLTFDANKRGRSAAPRLSCVDANGTTGCTLLGCTFRNALGKVGKTGTSSVAVSASNGCERLLVERCTVSDCGISANFRPSDGIFVRGNDCIIRQCHAENVTDHAFVLEGCNRSRIEDCTANNCTSIAAISNDTADDVEGNLISGIKGNTIYLGSFGGVVGAYALGRGRIRNSIIRDIDVTVARTARGQGAGLYFHGPMEGVVVDNAAVDAGSSNGVMTHAVAIERVSGVEICNSRLRADAAGTCIRILGGSSGVRLVRNRLGNGLYGIYADGASRFVEAGNVFTGCRTPIELAGRATFRRIG